MLCMSSKLPNVGHFIFLPNLYIGQHSMHSGAIFSEDKELGFGMCCLLRSTISNGLFWGISQNGPLISPFPILASKLRAVTHTLYTHTPIMGSATQPWRLFQTRPVHGHHSHTLIYTSKPWWMPLSWDSLHLSCTLWDPTYSPVYSLAPLLLDHGPCLVELWLYQILEGQESPGFSLSFWRSPGTAGAHQPPVHLWESANRVPPAAP